MFGNHNVCVYRFFFNLTRIHRHCELKLKQSTQPYSQSDCKILLAGVACIKTNVIAGEVSRKSDSLVCERGSQTAAVISSMTSVCPAVPLQKVLEWF